MSLHQCCSRNSTIELKASLNKIEELKGNIEELDAILQNFELQVELLETNNEHWKEQLQCSQASVNYPTSSCSNPRDNPTNPVVPNLDNMAEMDKARVELLKQLEDRCKWLEEKFRAMENVDYLCKVDAKELHLVPDLVLPPKYKIPKFKKEIIGLVFLKPISQCSGYINNDQLLIHCFQDSLIRSAAKWYNHLSRAKINSWKDLA
ncbi:hypothetical protein PVK06_017352 [Gossypium arboreum]|uniref:Uncharacterized protein n=1 Tax=Gossypium arboreum TaxID=29729 RepID=A0ABR0Q359_GOSAR|nr:hypothetical protein PVK06_017352 [Gossypium arboreum]